MTTTDTDPDGPALFDDDEATDDAVHARRDAADALLQKFTKPRPPAPTPKQRAESNGDPFVAYSAVHSPAFSARPHITAPGVRVEGLSAAPVDSQLTDLPLVEENTAIVPERRARRYVVLGALVVLFLILVGTVSSVALRSPEPKVEGATPSATQPAAIPTSKLDIPPPPELSTLPTIEPVPSSAPIAPPSAPRPLPRATSPQAPRQGSSTPALNTNIPEDPL